MRQAREEGRTIFTCGNGGSASTASHFVCDVLKGASFNRPKRFRIMALTDSLPHADRLLQRCQLRLRLRRAAQEFRPAGRPPHIHQRQRQFAERAEGGGVCQPGRHQNHRPHRPRWRAARAPLSIEINVADPHMGRIEDGHMIVCHMMAYYFMDTEKPGSTC